MGCGGTGPQPGVDFPVDERAAADPYGAGATVKELVDQVIGLVNERRDAAVMPASREFALALTALEDAQMRYARGRHMQEGSFSPSDVDRWKADGQDPIAVRDQRDWAAGKRA